MSTKRIAFFGLGLMGLPIAAHLARGGHTLYVCNRSPQKVKELCEQFPHNVFPILSSEEQDYSSAFNKIFSTVDVIISMLFDYYNIIKTIFEIPNLNLEGKYLIQMSTNSSNSDS